MRWCYLTCAALIDAAANSYNSRLPGSDVEMTCRGHKESDDIEQIERIKAQIIENERFIQDNPPTLSEKFSALQAGHQRDLNWKDEALGKLQVQYDELERENERLTKELSDMKTAPSTHPLKLLVDRIPPFMGGDLVNAVYDRFTDQGGVVRGLAAMPAGDY